MTHDQAWPAEQRRSDTIRFIKLMADMEALHLIRPAHVATTYHGMTECQVEAEMMKHLPGSEGK